LGEHQSSRGVQAGGWLLSNTERTVRVLPDVGGIDAEFDYTVPAESADSIAPGSIVRIDLQGRRVRGWVTRLDSVPPKDVKLRPIRKLSSIGPTQEVIELARWAALRWSGKPQFFLDTGSPDKNVSRLTSPAVKPTGSQPSWLSTGETVYRLGPACDPMPYLSQLHEWGPVLILAPSQALAARIARQLRGLNQRPVALYPADWAIAASGGATIVGTRSAAWASTSELHAVVAIDCHDQAYVSEASPTWNAIDVLAKRADFREIPAVFMSSTLPASLVEERAVVELDRSAERNGWAPVSVIDTRNVDPRKRLYSPELVDLIRSSERVLCVVNRTGRAQLLVCTSCGDAARCNTCDRLLTQVGDQLQCSLCESTQPVVCKSCGSTAFKSFRPGVNKVRDELARLTKRQVGEVTRDTEGLPEGEVLVGTEALLHRVNRADAVVFLEFDQELLAPRMSASEDALVLLARASRLVGGRKRGGRVIVQATATDHEVLDAAVHADPTRLLELEQARRKELNWPPFTSIARISGAGADPFVKPLIDGESGADLQVLGPDDRGHYLVKAPPTAQLGLELSRLPRPARLRLRIEVDPPRL
jgi:primosomal protein N' (replication factor Y) (superfamily II helicase)